MKARLDRLSYFILGAGYILALVALKSVFQPGLNMSLIPFGIGLFLFLATVFLIVSIIGITISAFIEVRDILVQLI